jgi:hypothetical protein
LFPLGSFVLFVISFFFCFISFLLVVAILLQCCITLVILVLALGLITTKLVYKSNAKRTRAADTCVVIHTKSRHGTAAQTSDCQPKRAQSLARLALTTTTTGTGTGRGGMAMGRIMVELIRESSVAGACRRID